MTCGGFNLLVKS